MRKLTAREIHPGQLRPRKQKPEKEWPTPEMIAAECALIRAERAEVDRSVDAVWEVPVVKHVREGLRGS